ncbi:MAG: hypothetical protein ACU85E_02130 [Gammaproteobacteria bacterium]
MNQDNDLMSLKTEHQATCRLLDNLKNQACQDNTSARMAYDQCKIALDDTKQLLEHYLNELDAGSDQEKADCLKKARQALVKLKALIQEAQIKVNNARPQPPFLY